LWEPLDEARPTVSQREWQSRTYTRMQVSTSILFLSHCVEVMLTELALDNQCTRRMRFCVLFCDFVSHRCSPGVIACPDTACCARRDGRVEISHKMKPVFGRRQMDEIHCRRFFEQMGGGRQEQKERREETSKGRFGHCEAMLLMLQVACLCADTISILASRCCSLPRNPNRAKDSSPEQTRFTWLRSPTWNWRYWWGCGPPGHLGQRAGLVDSPGVRTRTIDRTRQNRRPSSLCHDASFVTSSRSQLMHSR